MAGPFGATSTTDEVLEGVDLSGKRILVTGVSAGLGVETARTLAAHGATVVGAARDLDKAKARHRAGPRAGAQNGGGLELVELDLASLASVRACADALIAAGKPFDVIIANAGVMACPKGETADGFETQFGTNHLGHFVLVNRIASLLKPGARLVNLSSAGHRFSDVDLDDPNFEHTPYTEFGAYGRSKTANILFAVEFDRRHKADGVRATAVHPGGIQTELGRHMTPEVIAGADRPDQRRQPGRRRAGLRVEDHPAGRGDLGLGRRRRAGRRGRRPLLRGLPRGRARRRAPTSAAASAPTPSIRSTPRRCGPRAKRWSANVSDKNAGRVRHGPASGGQGGFRAPKAPGRPWRSGRATPRTLWSPRTTGRWFRWRTGCGRPQDSGPCADR